MSLSNRRTVWSPVFLIKKKREGTPAFGGDFASLNPNLDPVDKPLPYKKIGIKKSPPPLGGEDLTISISISVSITYQGLSSQGHQTVQELC